MGITTMLRPKGKRGRRKNLTGTDGRKIAPMSVALDHPAKGERVTAPCYTLRVGAIGDVERVEVAVDEGPWQSCRQAVGYWWYDWADYKGGWHRVVARACAADGRTIESETRKFRVALGPAQRPRHGELVRV